MSTKVKINNEIILMRKFVKQAKLCSIRKWIKQAENLKKKKGSEAQLEKNKRLSKRLIDQVMALKSTKNDEITKFALSNNRTFKNIAEDHKLKPKERAIAFVAFYKKFEQKILEFKKKFPDYEIYINNYNKNIVTDEVNQAEKRNEFKNKKIQKSKKCEEEIEPTSMKNLKYLSSDNLKNVTHDLEHIENGDNNSTIDDSDNDVNSCIEDYSENSNNIDEEKETPDNSDEDVDIDDDSDDDDDDDDEEDSEDNEVDIEENEISQSVIETDKDQNELNKRTKGPMQEFSKKRKKSGKLNPIKSKINHEKSIEQNYNYKNHDNINLKNVKQLNKKSLSSTLFSNVNEDSMVVEEENFEIPKNLEKEADPFFVSCDSTEYMRIKTPKSCDNERSQGNKCNQVKEKFSRNNEFQHTSSKSINKNFNYKNNSEFKNSAKNKFNNKFVNKNVKHDKYNKQQFDDYHNRKGNFVINKNKKDYNNSMQNSSVSNQKSVKSPPKSENLHPSWEAKRKQQEALKLGFQGKKIVFDD